MLPSLKPNSDNSRPFQPMGVASEPYKPLRLLAVVLLCLLLSVSVRAQIKFMQLTDPHLFDEGNGGVTKANEIALKECVNEINNLNAGNDYQFVVVTGDIGIEKIVKGQRAERDDARNDNPAGANDSLHARIEQRAHELAAIIKKSSVSKWLFLPGNNDLVDEWPETIGYYQWFMHALADAAKPNVEVIDLSPRVDNPTSGFYQWQDYVFLGFNDASFKNNDDPPRVTSRREWQLEEIRRVAERLQASQAHYAYIFYHIPEVPDPFLEFQKEQAKEKLSQRVPALSSKAIDEVDLTSSWFVAPDVRAAWMSLISNEKVRGLFAGHLHDPDRKFYLDYHSWMGAQLGRQACATLNKLYISPPIAIKRQETAATTARGFRVVNLDARGAVVTGQGKRGTQIYWFEQDKTPAAAVHFEPSPESDERQDETQCKQPPFGDRQQPISTVSPVVPWYRDITKIKDLLTVLGIIVGGLFAYYKFLKGRVFKARLELKVSGKITTSGTKRVLIAAAQLKNTGLAQVYLSPLTSINLYRSAPLTSPEKERQPAWAEPVNSFPMFVTHTWVEPDETIYDQILIELRDEQDTAYRLELFVRSRWPSLKERFAAWQKHQKLGGEWTSNSIAEEKQEAGDGDKKDETGRKP
jgi:hypothetical protein